MALNIVQRSTEVGSWMEGQIKGTNYPKYGSHKKRIVLVYCMGHLTFALQPSTEYTNVGLLYAHQYLQVCIFAWTQTTFSIYWHPTSKHTRDINE